MNQFIDIKKGLKENHLNTSPLFEKIYTPPSHGNDMISRLYEDGSLYYLINSSDVSRKDELVFSWGYVSKIEKEAVDEIRAIIEKCCEIDFKEKVPGNLPGLVKWKLMCNDMIKKVDVKGIPEGNEKLFDEIDKLISTRIIKV